MDPLKRVVRPVSAGGRPSWRDCLRVAWRIGRLECGWCGDFLGGDTHFRGATETEAAYWICLEGL